MNLGARIGNMRSGLGRSGGLRKCEGLWKHGEVEKPRYLERPGGVAKWGGLRRPGGLGRWAWRCIDTLRDPLRDL